MPNDLTRKGYISVAYSLTWTKVKENMCTCLNFSSFPSEPVYEDFTNSVSEIRMTSLVHIYFSITSNVDAVISCQSYIFT